MGRLSDVLLRLSTGPVTLALLVFFLAFTAVVLPGQAHAAEGAASGAGSPDTSFFYTPQELYRMAEAYGSEGRQAYIRARFTFDVIWPLVYTAFLLTSISWMLRAAEIASLRGSHLNLMPLVGMSLDYLENAATSLVMARYPSRTPLVDGLAPIFTFTKWSFIGASFLVLVGLGVTALYRSLARRLSSGRR